MPDYEKLYNIMQERENKRLDDEIMQMEVRNEWINMLYVGFVATIVCFLWLMMTSLI